MYSGAPTAFLAAVTALGAMLSIVEADDSAVSPKTAEALLQSHCAACHGVGGQGGVGGALIGTSKWNNVESNAIAERIARGAPDRGMPAFADVLSDDDIATLALYISELRTDTQMVKASPDITAKTVLYDIAIERVFSHPDQLWGLAIAGDGSIIATTKQGDLLKLSPDGDALTIKNPPEAYTVGVGGLLGVALHPNYAANGWIYVAAAQRPDATPGSTPGASPLARMRVLRGKIRDGAWADEEVVFETSAEDAHINRHFGARLLFHDGLLYLCLGDRHGDILTPNANAQRLDNPYGKIHRMSETGAAPADNPFIGESEAIPTIYTLGHRAPQGLTVRPKTGQIFSSEHGPRGGDELNIILPGRNYGWPLTSYGVQYSGEPVSLQAEHPDVEAPKRNWTPAIAVSAIQFYEGALFPEWNDSLFVGSLIAEKLIRMTLDEDGVPILEELVFKDMGRIRDIAVGADGSIYVAVNKLDHADSEILLLTPLN